MPLEILDGIAVRKCEAVYQAFYPACQASGFDIPPVVAKITATYDANREPVVRSYCFLLLGAVVDSGRVSKDTQQSIAGFLERELATLSDFRAKDGHGRWIHTLNHMTYLAESLPYEGLHKAVASAYLRSGLPFYHNEDVIVAGYLLGGKDLSAIIPRLLPDTGGNMVMEANKKALWMGMYVLNTRMQRQYAGLFAPFVDGMVTMALDP